MIVVYQGRRCLAPDGKGHTPATVAQVHPNGYATVTTDDGRTIKAKQDELRPLPEDNR